jgi:hypothetical protein
MTIPGVDRALAFVAAIDDPERFRATWAPIWVWSRGDYTGGCRP